MNTVWDILFDGDNDDRIVKFSLLSKFFYVL